MQQLIAKGGRRDSVENYVTACFELQIPDGIEGPIEMHHILQKAKSQFPQYAKDPRNLAPYAPIEHFRLHYLLAIAMPDNSAALIAFTSMANIRGWDSLRIEGLTEEEISKMAKVYEAGREKVLAHLAILNADPAMMEKRNAAIRSSDKHKTQVATLLAILNVDPATVEKRKAHLAIFNASDKHKAQLALLNADPATVEKRKAHLAIFNADPAMVEKRNAAIRASDKHKAHLAIFNADPAMVEKRNAAIRASDKHKAHIAALNADPKIQFRKRCAWGVKRGEECVCGHGHHKA